MKETVREILKSSGTPLCTISRFLGGRTTKPLHKTLSFKVLYKVWELKGKDGIKKIFKFVDAVKEGKYE